MFYLKEFFKIFEDSPIKGAMFLFWSCVLASSLTHRVWISQTIQQITPEKMIHPYFVAFLEGPTHLKKMKNIMKEFPGVISVKDRDNSQSKKKVMKLISALGKDYTLDKDLMSYHSIKVILNSSLSRESLEFVRSQIVKLGKKNQLSASLIKFPEITKEMQNHPFYYFIKKVGDWGVISLFIVCWLVSYWLCYPLFRSRGYLIEKFQRKKQVSSKIVSSGLGLIFIFFTSFAIWNGTIHIADLLILMFLFVIAWIFMLSDWRWNSR